jgi:adenosyl cobinamide kinase/adenosyl cobinamide phosphate guanylyltransferase
MSMDAAARAGRLTLVLGGARSGKSRYAQTLAMAMPPPWIFIATAEAGDEEMRARIEAHRRMRGEGWLTTEAPVDLAGAVSEAPESVPLLIDCLTLWLSNLMIGAHDVDEAIAAFEQALGAREAATIAVANEVGLGIVPETPLGRAFRDRAGALNQRLAAKAGTVVLMVAGLPMTVKASP